MYLFSTMSFFNFPGSIIPWLLKTICPPGSISNVYGIAPCQDGSIASMSS
jgi:hypothetical protein